MINSGAWLHYYDQLWCMIASIVLSSAINYSHPHYYCCQWSPIYIVIMDNNVPSDRSTEEILTSENVKEALASKGFRLAELNLEY